MQESCSAAVLDGTDIVYVLRVPTHKIMSISLGVGSRLPAYCTSMGRMLLAGLPEDEVLRAPARPRRARRSPATPLTDVDALLARVAQARRQGWCLVNQELEEGLVSMAAPIVDRAGRTVAALNISGQANRTSAKVMQEHDAAAAAGGGAGDLGTALNPHRPVGPILGQPVGPVQRRPARRVRSARHGLPPTASPRAASRSNPAIAPRNADGSASLRSSRPTGSSVPAVSMGRRTSRPSSRSARAAPSGVIQTASERATTARATDTSSVCSVAGGSARPSAERKLSVVWRGIVPSP